ncbi:MAG: amino acid ABC transporter permease [Tissierellia bacterium]|nr:amino acid ABC transporter permease [Tissierellia bacterium]
MLDFFLKYKMQFLRGTLTTLEISLVGTIIGLLIGLAVGIVRTIPMPKKGLPRIIKKCADGILVAYITFFRGTPMMVQSMLLFYGLKEKFNIDMAPMAAAFFIVTINTGAYLSEVVRGGISSIDKGQFEAAKALGMNHFSTMIYVVLPQALRNILPATGNEFVINVKDTSVLNVIGVTELYFSTKSIAGSTFRFAETFMITCLIYLFLTMIISFVLHRVEKSMDGPKHFRLPGSNQMQV